MKRMKKHKLLVLLVVALNIVFLVWCLGGVTVTPSPQSPLEKLDQARSLWNKQNISSYRMTVQFIRSFGFTGTFNFTIESNKVVKIEVADNYQAYLSPVDSYQPQWYMADTGYAAYFPKSLDAYTIDQLFDFAADKVRNDPAPPVIAWCSESFTEPTRKRYDVTFDQKRGNISDINFTDCPKLPELGLGFLDCPMETDCGNGFSIYNLTPLSN